MPLAAYCLHPFLGYMSQTVIPDSEVSVMGNNRLPSTYLTLDSHLRRGSYPTRKYW